VANAGDGSVTRIDQRVNRVTGTIAVATDRRASSWPAGSVWVTKRS